MRKGGREVEENLFGTDIYKKATEALDLIFRKSEQLSYGELERILACMRAVVLEFRLQFKRYSKQTHREKI